jgi:phosphohistidine swiveling domain-containing protein
MTHPDQISYILPLDHPQAVLENVGGKGASLARLTTAGLPVPGGFHVTTRAYRLFVAENDLQPLILQALQSADPTRPQTLEDASQRIQELFVQARIPPEVAGAIAQAYAALPGAQPTVAVRSSATAEDLPELSFAGQQATFLNVHEIDPLLAAVQRCWASLWTARAIGYRMLHNIDQNAVSLAVVVQLLVPADAAGIAFTANPLNGAREQMVINAAWGLGEAVVGGQVTPDSLVIDKNTLKVASRQTNEKMVMTARVNGGVQEQPVPAALRKAPVLSDDQASELARLCQQIEQVFGQPMDIEWALQDGRFTILQARPITALPEAPIDWTPPSPKGVYMRGSVVDILPAPLSPLFASLGIPTLRNQMIPLATRMTYAKAVLHEDYFTTINNYAYMNSTMPPKTWWWVITGMIPAYPRLLRKIVPIWREELHPEYQAFVASMQDKIPAEMSEDGLWSTAQQILDAAMYYVCGLMFATMGASAGSEMLLTSLYNKLAKQEGDPPATTLLMGWDNIPIRAEKSLYDLAMWAQGHETLCACLLETPADQLVEQLAGQLPPPESVNPVEWAELRQRFEKHLEQFGHIIFQLDFAEPLPLDRPQPMLENIKMYLRGEGANPHQRQQTSEAKRIQTTETMLNRLKGLKLWAFRIALNWGQSMASVREDALAEIGLAYPKLRAMLFELGNRFTAAGLIEQADDIFWLEKDDIDKLVAGQHLRLAGCVAERKASWQRLKAETPPPMIPMKERVMGIKTDIFVAQSADAHTGNILKGVAASAGVVTAPACVINNPEDFGLMRPGSVLVAGATTPAWTPLFAMASAVVTDIGGPLSHGSIVAREYGIPAVMGTGIATRRIQNGQTITVDGNAGLVTLGNNGGSQG